jgi:ArsR family transcriptional regulator, arsenate/arsenite/antimonite-responsive transcriptional repressor
MKEMVKVFKAVADPNRIRILKMLQQKKMCVCELSAVLGITQPSVSRHLSMLRDAGLVRDERNCQWIDYDLCEENVNKYAPVLMKHIRTWINEDPRVSRDASLLKTLNREKLCKKV